MANIDCIIVHYDEIGLKGDNRGSFEKQLMQNILAKGKGIIDSVKKESGQLTISIPKGADLEALFSILSKTPGIAFFSPGKKCSLNIEALKKDCVEFLRGMTFETFKIDAQRHNKDYKLTSTDLNKIIGAEVAIGLGKKAKMKMPDLTLKVEVNHTAIYLSCRNIEGVGGLPTNPRESVVALLSGGFDSPVAAYMMMKRGANVILVHFQNENQMSTGVGGKIRDLAEQLAKFQHNTMLYIVPFGNIQREIIMKSNAKARMIVYRRIMLKLASMIADSNDAGFLVVGDSLSQVASQTIKNLEVTYSDAGKSIFTPLIGMNKREIIDLSRRIGTYGISARPYGDCCSYFLPKHPELKADKKSIAKIESEVDLERLAKDAIKNAEIIKYE